VQVPATSVSAALIKDLLSVSLQVKQSAAVNPDAVAHDGCLLRSVIGVHNIVVESYAFSGKHTSH